MDREKSSKGEFTIVTSTISITEVAFAELERGRGNVDPAIERQIDALFADRSVVTLVEFHETIARRARAIMRSAIHGGRSVKPLDAIHLATAAWRGVSVFHSYDEQLQRGHELVGFPIAEPATQRPRMGL